MTSGAEQSQTPALHVGGVWLVGDAIVLVRRDRPVPSRWTTPGGTVRAGETLAEAVVRCVADDAGVEALCGPFLGWGEVVDSGDHVVTMYFEVVVLDRPEIDPDTGSMPPGRATAEVRCTPDWEVSELPVVAGLAEFLADQGLIELVV